MQSLCLANTCSMCTSFSCCKTDFLFLFGLLHQVSDGLFTRYQLPNGRTAFLYCNAGAAMDEAEFAAVQPPVRPTTVPLALQQSMPLAQVMSLIAKPPGTAPPYRPPKPVPRLVPLPGSHTLTVSHPELRTAESYGQLRADNLQLVLKAEVRSVAVRAGQPMMHLKGVGRCFLGVEALKGCRLQAVHNGTPTRLLLLTTMHSAGQQAAQSLGRSPVLAYLCLLLLFRRL